MIQQIHELLLQKICIAWGNSTHLVFITKWLLGKINRKNIKKLITEFIYLKNNECKIVFIQQFKTLQIQLLKKDMAMAKYYGT